YMVTNKGADVDLLKLVLFDPQTSQEELVESDPMNRVDLEDPLFSDLSDELIATTYNDERLRIYWKDPAFEADYKLLQSKLPGKEIGFGSLTTDEQLALIVAYSDTDPGARYLFNRKTKELTLQYRAFEKIPREDLAAMQSIR